jgi:hypothetical protein
VTAVLLWWLAELTEPAPTIALCLVTWLFHIPITGLTNAFCFRQVEHPERDYGKIRLWGTVGWIAASWCLSLWFLLLAWLKLLTQHEDWSDSLRLGGLAAGLLAVYALTLPHTPPQPVSYNTGARQLWFLRLIDAPLAALRLFREPSFSVYMVCLFGLYVTIPFTTQLNPLLLNRIGIEPEVLPFYLTIAQSTEVLSLALLPILLARLGVKPTMVLGNLLWTCGLFLLSFGAPAVLVLAALPTHGVFICCFLVAGQVFVNRLATHDIRASTQALLLFVTGSALLLGHLLVGVVRTCTDDSFRTAYLLAAGLSGLILAVFLAGFAAPPAAISEQEPLVPDSEIA